MRAWALSAAIVLIATSAFAASLGSANDDEKKPLPPLQKNFPLDETFSLRDLNGKPVSSTLDVSFKLDGSFHASGFSGCNSYSATAYPQTNQHILVGGLVMTKKTCEKANQAIESGFFRALMGTPTWDLVNGDLVIKGPGGEIRMARSL